MANLPTSGRTERSGLPNTEGWEIIMKQKVPVVRALQSVDLLFIVRGAQSDNDQALRLSSGKER